MQSQLVNCPDKEVSCVIKTSTLPTIPTVQGMRGVHTFRCFTYLNTCVSRNSYNLMLLSSTNYLYLSVKFLLQNKQKVIYFKSGNIIILVKIIIILEITLRNFEQIERMISLYKFKLSPFFMINFALLFERNKV